jgi:hypothetical protein
MSLIFAAVQSSFNRIVELFPKFRCAVCLLIFGEERYMTLAHFLNFRKHRAKSRAIHSPQLRRNGSGTTAFAARLHREPRSVRKTSPFQNHRAYQADCLDFLGSLKAGLDPYAFRRSSFYNTDARAAMPGQRDGICCRALEPTLACRGHQRLQRDRGASAQFQKWIPPFVEGTGAAGTDRRNRCADRGLMPFATRVPILMNGFSIVR